MTLDVEVAGRTRRVAVRRERHGWAVTVDGRELSVDAAASNGRWSFLIRGSGEAGQYGSYEVAVETRGPGEQVIHVNGHPIPVRIADARTLFGRRGQESSSASGPARLMAPMPGRVVKVLVKPGDTAAAGQPLVVVEAMKMENELRAPRGGTVSEVRVGEGSSIDANTILVVLR